VKKKISNVELHSLQVSRETIYEVVIVIWAKTPNGVSEPVMSGH
jgi:hypothetical protein